MRAAGLTVEERASRSGVAARLAACWLLSCPVLAAAQVNLGSASTHLTLEGYNNATAGESGTPTGRDGLQLDAGLRVLALQAVARDLRLGARVVLEGQAGLEDDLDFGERSLLLTSSIGRFELGYRQGLPDILTGYGPNNFTFTGAEFGPASGLSLDPAGGLPALYQPPAVAAALSELSVAGYATSLFYDRSAKLIWVAPKTGGFLGGFSYAPDADDAGDQLAELVQAGITRETYWDQNVLRVGGSWSSVRAATGERLHSFQAGFELTWRYDWLLGLAVTSNPDAARTPLAGWAEDGRGLSTSLNYNHGRWTVGGFAQWSRSRPPGAAHDERLTAAEVGISYRQSTRVRLYLGYYRFNLTGVALDDGDHDHGAVLLGGLRLTL